MKKEKWHCEICSEEIEVDICCNAFDCGCEGLPEFPFCSKECYEKYREVDIISVEHDTLQMEVEEENNDIVLDALVDLINNGDTRGLLKETLNCFAGKIREITIKDVEKMIEDKLSVSNRSGHMGGSFLIPDDVKK